MSVKPVKNSGKWNWKEEPLRFAPAQQTLLCEHCWNNMHWRPAYSGINGTWHAKTKNCLENGCHCGCVHDVAGRPLKFTGEGQMEIQVEPIQIGPNS